MIRGERVTKLTLQEMFRVFKVVLFMSSLVQVSYWHEMALHNSRHSFGSVRLVAIPWRHALPALLRKIGLPSRRDVQHPCRHKHPVDLALASHDQLGRLSLDLLGEKLSMRELFDKRPAPVHPVAALAPAALCRQHGRAIRTIESLRAASQLL